MTEVEFRFDAATHRYTDLITGTVYPSITQMLELDGLIDSEWYTPESAARGTLVHDLTAQYCLGALTVAGYPDDAPCRGYLLSHDSAMGTIPHTFVAVEEPRVSARWRFGGRPDRVGDVYGLRAVVEGKSGDPEPAHAIQTALQAILEAERWGLPPQAVARFCLYWRENGKWKLVEHTRARDFDTAFAILRRHAA